MINKRIYISKSVRYELLLASAGRCEMCNKPIDHHALTKERVRVGEYAHIIADSVDGPRGNEHSKELANDPSNLMLLCLDCHKNSDFNTKNYLESKLRIIKARHEKRISLIYNVTEHKTTLPIILKHPIGQMHVPSFTHQDIYAAILNSSIFHIFPHVDIINFDYDKSQIIEGDINSWSALSKRMLQEYQYKISLINQQSIKIEHISIFAFGPMPLLMQLGLYIGNKCESSIFQWDRNNETWLFPLERSYEKQEITWNEIPVESHDELAIKISLSAEVDDNAVREKVTNIPIIRLGVPKPTTMLVESNEDIVHFRTKFHELMCLIRNAGFKRIHLFPAMPMSLAVELGRQLLPKADPKIKVWDYKNSTFYETLNVSDL